jgi:hypothetical protein
MTEHEEPLASGHTTKGVVRVGDTVRRPLHMNSAFVHRLLEHLAVQGHPGVPRFLGLDEKGREMLSFLPGEVPDDLGVFSDEQVHRAARLLRRLHDVTQESVLRDPYEVVCHGDPSPCNCVFVDDLPVGFIDFDAARPGNRRDDVGYAAWMWLEIGNDELEARAQGRRLVDFFLAYGALDPAGAVHAVLDAQTELAQRKGTPSETKRWAETCRDWVTQHFAELSDTRW